MHTARYLGFTSRIDPQRTEQTDSHTPTVLDHNACAQNASKVAKKKLARRQQEHRSSHSAPAGAFDAAGCRQRQVYYEPEKIIAEQLARGTLASIHLARQPNTRIAPSKRALRTSEGSV